MSEHNVSATPATPMDAIKQIYELFQHVKNFTIGFWARDYVYAKVTTNDAHACCWCLSGAVFHIYNLDVNIIYQLSAAFPENVMDTFKLLWEKLPAESKINALNISWDYIGGIAKFNDEVGYTGVMRLLKAVVDDTEYAGGINV